MLLFQFSLMNPRIVDSGSFDSNNSMIYILQFQVFIAQGILLYYINLFLQFQVFIALGILLCYIMGRSLEWNWLALAACLFLFPFVFGLYFIPESPPWLIYNDEEDLAYKSMLMIRGEEYDASIEICKIKDNLARHKNDLHAMLLESVDHMGNTNR